MTRIAPYVIAVAALALSACTNHAGYPAYPPSYQPQGNGAYAPYSGSPSYGDPRDLGEAPLPPSPGYEYQNPPSSPAYPLPDYRSSAIF